jgi:hypothetical protein
MAMTSDSQIELNKNNNTIVVILVPHVLSDKMLHPSAAYSGFFLFFFVFLLPVDSWGPEGQRVQVVVSRSVATMSQTATTFLMSHR